jgi:hypothetical protein
LNPISLTIENELPNEYSNTTFTKYNPPISNPMNIFLSWQNEKFETSINKKNVTIQPEYLKKQQNPVMYPEI